MNEDVIKAELNGGETIIWTGRPTKRLLTNNERFRIPVSLALIAVFAVYWFAKDELSPVTIVLVIFSLLVVLYSTVGTLVIKAVRRSRTHYALTEDRLIFVLTDKNGARKKTASADFDKIRFGAVELNKNGTGTVLFSENKNIDRLPLKIGDNWQGSSKYPFIAFFDVENPKEVFSKFKRVKKETAPDDEPEAVDIFSKYDE